MRLVLAVVVLACACSHNPPTRPLRPALVEERSEPDAGGGVTLAAEPSELEASDKFGRCTAPPVQLVDPEETGCAVEAHLGEVGQ